MSDDAIGADAKKIALKIQELFDARSFLNPIEVNQDGANSFSGVEPGTSVSRPDSYFALSNIPIQQQRVMLQCLAKMADIKIADFFLVEDIYVDLSMTATVREIDKLGPVIVSRFYTSEILQRFSNFAELSSNGQHRFREDGVVQTRNRLGIFRPNPELTNVLWVGTGLNPIKSQPDIIEFR